MATVKQPTYKLTYRHHNITHDIASSLLSVTYTDNLTGESDELDVEIEDTDGKWMDDWYPAKGSLMTLALGYVGEPLMDCGSFEVDEIEFSDSPSVVRIRALSAGVTLALRTQQHRAFEETTLLKIVTHIARLQGYTVKGSIANIPIDRVTQNESDLSFIKRLADTYGYAIKMTGKTLAFLSFSELKNAPSQLTFTRADITNWRLRDQINSVYQGVQAKHHDPKKKKLLAYNSKDGKSLYTEESRGQATSNNTLNMRSRATDQATQDTKAQAALSKKNDKQTEGSFSTEGNKACRAGHVITLDGFGRLSGRWRIKKAVHQLSRTNGYVADVEFQRVDARPVERSTKKKPKKNQAVKVYDLQDGQLITRQSK
jgi:phage protein D